MSKKPLTKAIKEKCRVEIMTSDQEGDYMDVDLNIKFLSGTLKGQEYKFSIDLKSYKRVGWD